MLVATMHFLTPSGACKPQAVQVLAPQPSPVLAFKDGHRSPPVHPSQPRRQSPQALPPQLLPPHTAQARDATL